MHFTRKGENGENDRIETSHSWSHHIALLTGFEGPEELTLFSVFVFST